MKYIYNNQELSAREIKALNPNISYSDPTKIGAIPVLPTPRPTVEWNEIAQRDGTEVDSLGNTIEKWKVVPKFTEYTTEEGVVVTVAEQEADELARLTKEKAKQLEAAIDKHVLDKCVELGYTTENHIAKYLVEGNDFYEEAKALSLWIGKVWSKSNEVANKVQAGEMSIPTEEELIAMLPVYEGVVV